MYKKIWITVLLLFIVSGFVDAKEQKKVGLLIVATGKYIQFVEPLIKSAEQYFCTDHKVTYFVFTEGQVPARDDVVHVYQERFGWPHDTLLRCTLYHKCRYLMMDMDYLYACDSDMLFVDHVGQEIFSDRVGTQHPGFVHQPGSYETSPKSTAYVAPGEGSHYFAGGFHGGSRDEMFKLVGTMTACIEEDLSRAVIAVWHDESQLNRYFIDNPPTCILNPSYCFPGFTHKPWVMPGFYDKYPPKLVALDKNHAEFQN